VFIQFGVGLDLANRRFIDSSENGLFRSLLKAYQNNAITNATAGKLKIKRRLSMAKKSAKERLKSFIGLSDKHPVGKAINKRNQALKEAAGMGESANDKRRRKLVEDAGGSYNK